MADFPNLSGGCDKVSNTYWDRPRYSATMGHGSSGGPSVLRGGYRPYASADSGNPLNGCSAVIGHDFLAHDLEKMIQDLGNGSGGPSYGHFCRDYRLL